MARAVDNRGANRVYRQRFVGYFDALDRTLHGANDVVVEHNTFKRETKKAAVHASRFVN